MQHIWGERIQRVFQQKYFEKGLVATKTLNAMKCCYGLAAWASGNDWTDGTAQVH